MGAFFFGVLFCKGRVCGDSFLVCTKKPGNAGLFV